jgi:hypothetical protein
MTFSLDRYRALLRSALDAGFSPIPFTADELPKKRSLLLRHDIDYSLEMAVILARVNAELGVSGTFFILVRGHSYNPLSPRSQARIAELLAAGQRLGLHVAGGESDIPLDFELLAAQFPVERVFSWHNPTPEILDRYRGHHMVEGLVNVYSKRFLDDALYCSDSNFGRSYEQLKAAFSGERSAVHLLVHPINWVAGGDSMLDVFEHAWPYLLRESEQEARTNRVYAEHLPEGMPDSLLTEFSKRWREVAG